MYKYNTGLNYFFSNLSTLNVLLNTNLFSITVTPSAANSSKSLMAAFKFSLETMMVTAYQFF